MSVATVKERNLADHSRRQFSVLCWRGWCDNGFRDRDIAAMIVAASGDSWPVPVHLPVVHCPNPFTCECVCHDEMKAALGGQVTAHTAAEYSKGRGFGQDHAVLDQPLTACRFQRNAGEALCKPVQAFSGASPRGNGKVDCPECLARAQRYGVRLP